MEMVLPNVLQQHQPLLPWIPAGKYPISQAENPQIRQLLQQRVHVMIAALQKKVLQKLSL